ncbi:tyrosine-type recombinase/integrase [Alishewanella sp. SMS8]|uniref:tyrosine-type recombinase/integrase n=1 Tax=Alishewanella sp. SMS8 TaxID=2994676 RepID=UPI0027424677|nr:tyrosine-type recombinase/integrase [Alishewanella sp. SMS8]MDP5459582.1 tyrosine-type recombinase/integrase [Alishewanella sp. SMS8]
MSEKMNGVYKTKLSKAKAMRDLVVPFLFLEPQSQGHAFVVRKQFKGERHVCTLGHSSYMALTEARFAGMKWFEDKKNGVPTDHNKLILKQVIAKQEEWLSQNGTTNQIKYLQKNLNRLKGLSEDILAKVFSEIGKHDLEREVSAYRKTGVAEASVNRFLSGISSLYSFMKMLGYDIPNVCSEIKRRPEHNIRTNTLPVEAIKYYIQHLLKDSNWLAAYALIIMVSTGIRCGNVIAMNVDMVSPCLRYIHLPMTKSGKPQTVAVPQLLKQILQELLDNARKKNSHFLFPSDTSSTGHIASPRGPHERAIAALNAMGFDLVCTIHDLRRTFANQLLRASGGNVYLVSQALGHGSVAVTMRYLSIRSDELDEAVNLAAAALGLESLAA